MVNLISNKRTFFNHMSKLILVPNLKLFLVDFWPCVKCAQSCPLYFQPRWPLNTKYLLAHLFPLIKNKGKSQQQQKQKQTNKQKKNL